MKTAFTFELPSRRSTIRLAQTLSALVRGGDLLILSGGLGAGKTFFARALCRALGVGGEVAVTSPTFTLVHHYEGRIPIAHADLYRLNSASELRELGLLELRAQGSLLMVEWGEAYAEGLGGDALMLHFTMNTEERGRALALSASGSRSFSLCQELVQVLSNTGSSINVPA